MAEMMRVQQKLAIPGTPHELLASLTGNWNTITRTWMEAGKPPLESNGTGEQKILLGGCYLKQEFNGDMMGRPFSGIGITGYENHKEKFVTVWMDSMGKSIYFFEGVAEPDGKTIIQTSACDDPAKGSVKWRSVTKIVDSDTHLFEMFMTDKSGKEKKIMEITYIRKE